jgi:hypothetical protein
MLQTQDAKTGSPEFSLGRFSTSHDALDASKGEDSSAHAQGALYTHVYDKGTADRMARVYFKCLPRKDPRHTSLHLLTSVVEDKIVKTN